ncbi:MAG: zf-HC2 domain-containing protein [Chloroflexi bacterium]|nr:zf-HC2 domain-containing protein [Chloroflexota bacterium]
MRCRDIRRQLHAYLSGQLTPAQRLRIGRHLAQCERCYAAFQAELATVRHLEAYLPALGRPSAAQLARIWQNVKAQTRQTSARRADSRPAGALLTLTLALVCAAFIFRGSLSIAVAAPLPPSPAIARATATLLFTETPESPGVASIRPTASLTAAQARLPSAAPAPSARKP